MFTNPKRAAHLITGAQGEQRAAQFLQQQGLQLVQHNYRSPYGEIDVIARDGDCLVFVEVRRRKAHALVSASQSITANKIRKIRQTAQHYLLQQPHQGACRFDVIAIDGEQLQWIRGAFV